MGSLLGIYLSLVTVPEVLAQTRFHLVFKVAKDERDVKLRWLWGKSLISIKICLMQIPGRLFPIEVRYQPTKVEVFVTSISLTYFLDCFSPAQIVALIFLLFFAVLSKFPAVQVVRRDWIPPLTSELCSLLITRLVIDLFHKSTFDLSRQWCNFCRASV